MSSLKNSSVDLLTSLILNTLNTLLQVMSLYSDSTHFLNTGSRDTLSPQFLTISKRYLKLAELEALDLNRLNTSFGSGSSSAMNQLT